MSKIIKPDNAEPIAAPAAARASMAGIAIRFVFILAVIVVILTLAWSR